MASRTQVILISDLSGEEVGAGGETVNFSYRDVGYSIDLSAKEARAFDKAMAMYIEHAQRKAASGSLATCAGTSHPVTVNGFRQRGSGCGPTAIRLATAAASRPS